MVRFFSHLSYDVPRVLVFYLFLIYVNVSFIWQFFLNAVLIFPVIFKDNSHLKIKMTSKKYIKIYSIITCIPLF